MANCLNRNCSVIYTYIGIAYMNKGFHKDAFDFFTKATLIDPNNMTNFYYKSRVLYIMEKYDLALIEIEKIDYK